MAGFEYMTAEKARQKRVFEIPPAAGCYNFRIAGHNYGLGLTFGYLTGKFIAENE